MQQTNTNLKSNKHPDSLGACWIRESKSGADYLSIKLDSNKIRELLDDGDIVNIKAFLNGGKQDGDDRPEYILFPSKNIKKEEINGNK